METPHNNRTLSALYRLARAVSGGEFRARALLSRVCEAVADAFGFRRVAIFRYLEETNTIVPFAAHGAAPEQEEHVPAAPLDLVPIFQRALEEGKAVQSVSVAAEGALRPQAAAMLGVESLAVTPLITEGRCLGFLACDRAGERFALDEGELDLLSMMGTLTAVLLEKAIEQSQLRRLNELKSEFISLASHELRTPAAVIYGISETLRLRGDELPAARREELAQALYAHAGRLRHLVEQLLDLSRLEAEAVRIEPRLFERFSRAESEQRREGAGLGLSIAQSYAQAHGGYVAYVPAEPRGARFELVLPAQ